MQQSRGFRKARVEATVAFVDDFLPVDAVCGVPIRIEPLLRGSSDSLPRLTAKW